MKANAQDKLIGGSIPRLVLGYALSTFAALVFNSIYTITDSLFVSWGVSDAAMGGVSVVFPFVLIQTAISTALGGGAASVVSRALGKNDLETAACAAWTARVVFYVTAIVTTVLGFVFMRPMLRAFGTTDDLYQYAKEYYTIILLGNVFSTGFTAIARAEGKMLFSMLMWVIPITINIVLDAVFILALGWGVKGSAVATVICQFTSFAMSVVFFERMSMFKKEKKRVNRKAVGEILSVGLPALIQSLALSVMLLLMNNVLKRIGGSQSITAFAYVNKLVVLFTVPFLALSQAIGPIVGFNYGANRADRVRKTTIFALAVSIVYAAAAAALAAGIPTAMLKIFTADAELIAIGARSMRILAISLPFAPVAMLLGTVRQSEGKRAQALIIYSLNVVFLIVCEAIAAQWHNEDAVWWAYVIASAVTAVVSAGIYWIGGACKKKPLKADSISNGEL